MMNQKTRIHRFNRLLRDGDPWEPNNIAENIEQKKTKTPGST